MSNQGVRQAADANIPQLEPLEAEAVEVEAKAEEVDFTLMVETEGTVATVVVVEMTVTTMTTVMMIPMMMETLQIHVSQRAFLYFFIVCICTYCTRH